MAVVSSTIHRAGWCAAATLLLIGCKKASGANDSTKVVASSISADTVTRPAANIALPVTVEAARDGMEIRTVPAPKKPPLEP
jgi:hypothetical protein